MTPLGALSLHELLGLLAAPTPSPGGGAVAAIAGACGAALVEMVTALPRTRHDSAAERQLLDGIRPVVAAHRTRLEGLVDLDHAAFSRVVEARRLPKDNAQEEAERRHSTNEAFKNATLVPLETAERCAEVILLAAEVARAGRTTAASDVRVAVAMLRAGAEGAADIARVNLAAIDDRQFAATVTAKLATVAERLGLCGDDAAMSGETGPRLS